MRIAQITDLHLRQHLFGTAANNLRRSRSMMQMLPLALREAKNLGADMVAITGDLLDVPDWLLLPRPGFIYDDPAPWREAVVRDYQDLKHVLDASGVPCMVLPGNHDDPELMWRVFDPTANVMDVAGVRVARFCDREWDNHIPRRFAAERLRWEAMLGEDGHTQAQVHLQHYVLTPPLNHGWPHAYAEGEELARRTNASRRVRLCLSGHYHAGTGMIRFEHTVFATGPSFSMSPFPWRMYDVRDDAVSMTEHDMGAVAQAHRRVVFLDRDGVINDLASYCTGAEAMNLLPGAAVAIRRLREAGFAVVVVSNQTAVGCGYVPAGVVDAVNDRMHRLLAQEGAELDGVYYLTNAGERAALPEHRDNSQTKVDLMCRAAVELNLDLTGAWLVGDRRTDIAAAIQIESGQPILVRTGSGSHEENTCASAYPSLKVVDDLAAAANHILQSS